MIQCDCIKKLKEDVEKQFKENPPKHLKNKDVESVSFSDVFHVNDKTVSGATTGSRVLIEVEGQKKPFGIFITHNFCPFCGEKIIIEPRAEEKDKE